MAVEKQSKDQIAPIQHFYRKKRRFVLFVAVLLQVITTVILAVALQQLHASAFEDAFFWVLIITFFLLGLGINFIVMRILLRPLKGVSTALSYIAGEHLNENPPNPNDPSYIRSGTRLLLRLIYNLSGEPKNEVSAKQMSTGQKLEEALSDSRIGVALLNKDGDIIYANAQAPISLNSRGKKRIALNFSNGDELPLPDWIRWCQQESIQAEQVWTRLHTLPSAAQKEQFFDIAASYTKGHETETAIFFINRTNDYAIDEQDLDFIAFAAHELRGPITIIRGYLEVLTDELSKKLTDDQRLLFMRLEVSANRLTTYLNNILNVSRFDRDRYAIHISKQSVASIYASIADDMNGRARSQNRTIQIAIDPDLPLVAADPGSISEVFSNLIDNAIKYSNEGGSIEVYAKVSGNFVEITVQDHGIGMPNSVLRNIFHKFYRSHRSRESVAGSGIGLYIAKGIVDAHGGTISVSSNENRGSTFTFTLPIYTTVEEKLKTGDNRTQQLVEEDERKTWISNHNKYRG